DLVIICNNLSNHVNHNGKKTTNDGTKNVTLVLTKFHYSHRNKLPCLRAAMFFNQIRTIFEHLCDIIGTNVPTKFHEDRTLNVASSVMKVNVDDGQPRTDKRRSQ
ncbi:hypothetical protein DPMN_094518, partial [Dreissena polymorpha]